jgi:hypothetical protein
MIRRQLTVSLITLATAVMLPLGQATPANAQNAAGHKPIALFNGKDLTGWTDALDNASEWRVAEGILEGRGGGPEQPAVLVSERQDFTNFTLNLKYRFRKPGGGGIELRRSSKGERTSCYWVSARVNPEEGAADFPPGNIAKLKEHEYGEGDFPPARESAPIQAAPDRWHTLTITVTGNKIATFVNGRKADEFTDSKKGFRAGVIALFVRGDSTAQFQSIEIQELPE